MSNHDRHGGGEDVFRGVPEADAADQAIPAAPETDADEAPTTSAAPEEANPADAWEQQQPVPDQDEDYDYDGPDAQQG